jgi:hypothetical protein
MHYCTTVTGPTSSQTVTVQVMVPPLAVDPQG